MRSLFLAAAFCLGFSTAQAAPLPDKYVHPEAAVVASSICDEQFVCKLFRHDDRHWLVKLQQYNDREVPLLILYKNDADPVFRLVWAANTHGQSV